MWERGQCGMVGSFASGRFSHPPWYLSDDDSLTSRRPQKLSRFGDPPVVTLVVDFGKAGELRSSPAAVTPASRSTAPAAAPSRTPLVPKLIPLH